MADSKLLREAKRIDPEAFAAAGTVKHCGTSARRITAIDQARAIVAREDYAAFAERALAEIAVGAGLSYEEFAARLTPLPEIAITITNPAPVPPPIFGGVDFSTRPDQAGEYLAQNPPTTTAQDGKR